MFALTIYTHLRLRFHLSYAILEMCMRWPSIPHVEARDLLVRRDVDENKHTQLESFSFIVCAVTAHLCSLL